MKKTNKRTKLIITLVVLIVLVGILPIKEIIMNPSIVGHTIARVFVRGLETNHSCSAVFMEGWNLISIPCLATNTSPEFVLSSISGNYTSIHYYDLNNNTDHWKVYNPGLPSWVVNDLVYINEKDGYWINMKNQSNFHLDGTLIQPNDVPLVKGWNLMGYPTDNSKEITNALNPISGSYTIIWLYNASDSKYYYYNVSESNGTLYEMRPYYGYWINMSKNDSLFVI